MKPAAGASTKIKEKYKKELKHFKEGVKACVAGAFNLNITTDNNLLEGGYEFLEAFVIKEMNTIKNERNKTFRENLHKCK